MKLTIRLGNKSDIAWAQATVTEHHYLHQPVNNQARPMAYIIEYQAEPLGLVMAGIPHATCNKGWYGYPGLITKWQVLDLCRIWISPRLQKGGDLCRPEICPGFLGWRNKWWPSVASWAIEEVLSRIQRDRVSLWPPVFIEEPYHIRLVISYHDPKYHTGAIYKWTQAEPMYFDITTEEKKVPIPGPSGKYGWCWKLPEPQWGWWQIPILKPRTMRLPL